MKWLTIILIFIFITGCISVPGEEPVKKEDNEKMIKELNLQIDTLNKEKESLKSQINELKKEIEDLKSKEIKVEVPKTKEETEKKVSAIDLSSWKRDDILKAMSQYNNKFSNVSWFTFIYREDKHYYDQVGPIFDEDPFYGIKYKDRGDELKVNRLRMFNLAPGNATLGIGVYENEYLPLISKETLIDKDLECNKEEECGIKIIKCGKNEHKYYSWFIAPYLFVTRDDTGESLEAFKSFYCNG